ncbi:RHS repeat-associated protein [Nitrosomonas sp. Nm84]|uniref:RHS repeat-associated core domain-containing protein n=1 Tax=Nitrosomonas sp. Nm84 TaxID=200124 RepID=UPI000D80A5BA|nr:RHS repeat-associated core domain-containing protein [Nitrosomonas sp. Nm84]PXW87827.1 RHS repeat-associated protein [Nitrosomonas sp. Nm84]
MIGEYRDNSSTATPTDDWLVRQETIWLENIPIAIIRKPTSTSPIQIYFIHADHLNTPRVIVNQGNIPVWRWENIHAFGANLPDEDPDGNSQLFEYHPRFLGQYFDKETGLHYNYFRYYEPKTGRYLTPDSTGLTGGLNTYGYVSGNPMSFTDPTGEAIPAIIAACAGNPACAAAVSASVGAISGAAIDIPSQLLSNGGNLQCVDTGNVAISAGMDALSLGAIGAVGGKLLGNLATKSAMETKWILGTFKSEAKWAGQLQKRGCTPAQITEAIQKGKSFSAENLINKGNQAIRYVHPETGQSVVLDNVIKEVIHVGGLKFKY